MPSRRIGRAPNRAGATSLPPPYLRHVFICQNERDPSDPRGCGLARGSAGVRDAFKRELKARNLARTIRANNVGCLDACEHGVSMVVYPEGVWYGHVTEQDVLEIVESHLVGGRPVERLRILRDAPPPRMPAP
jgi:(2Fe-2S) ferredoxin